MNIFIHSLQQNLSADFEMVERKGLGHPDTICDSVAEAVSVALSKYYIEHFGSILHHNVDKALLVGGSAAPAYGGGKVLIPMEFYIAGRATSKAYGKQVPVTELAIATAEDWIGKHLRYLDVERMVKVMPKIRSGSQDLVELFQRFGKGEVALANDTSFGVGFYPYSTLEKAVLEIEKLLRQLQTQAKFPCIGEDTKVMGVRKGQQVAFTLAIAMVDRFIHDLEEYKSLVVEIRNYISVHLDIPSSSIFINTADDYEKESIYLTVTGCSAENGDDGQVGRGNRANGLITPYRPMSLEATAGKNPISHVGKIYNLWAHSLSREICKRKYAASAEVFIVSQIGQPINRPQLLDIRLAESQVADALIQELAEEHLRTMPELYKQLLTLENPFEPFLDELG